MALQSTARSSSAGGERQGSVPRGQGLGEAHASLVRWCAISPDRSEHKDFRRITRRSAGTSRIDLVPRPDLARRSLNQNDQAIGGSGALIGVDFGGRASGSGRIVCATC